MREGSGLVKFAERYPDRYFDTGIAEQHSVTFAAGLACEGYKPVVAIYSTFLQRAYDQLIHDVQIQNLPILFAIDRAGLVGGDGATHNGSYDLTYLRCLPNMTVMTPADENECRQMLYTGFQMSSPAAVRYPRGTGPGMEVRKEMTALAIGKGEIRRRGNTIAILAFGSVLKPALDAAGELDATVANMRFVKPLDDALVSELAESHDLLVTVEENVVMGGAGSAVLEALQRAGKQVPVLQLGLPDRFIDQGDPAIQLAHVGLNKDGIAKSIREQLAGKHPG
jgi:1-deoxy-D-xylulose-5-phosphate synthase